MMHIPQAAIQRWKGFVNEAGAKVSRFDLVASWVHLVRCCFSIRLPFDRISKRSLRAQSTVRAFVAD